LETSGLIAGIRGNAMGMKRRMTWNPSRRQSHPNEIMDRENFHDREHGMKYNLVNCHVS